MVGLDNLHGRKLGEFILRERLGEGGFGAVYRCEQRTLRREAVVKILHPRLRHSDVALQRFLREAQVATRLDHPYAAHVYAFGVEHDDGLCWIAMELVQGVALNRWLTERGPLPLDQFVPFFERVAEVVHTAHERGIVHRDLKPSNIMVIERAGRLLPKLLDFGIAKLLDDTTATAERRAPPDPTEGNTRNTAVTESMDGKPAADQVTKTAASTLRGQTAAWSGLTLPGSMIGSPPYMSPEQWGNAGTAGLASDLYSLAVVAYESLTGRRPFTSETLEGYAELHSRAAIPLLGDQYPPALDRFFERAMAKRPEDRWGNALELAGALRAASTNNSSAIDIPRLDPQVRDAWLANAPQPLAESIAELEAARNAHHARDTAQELARTLLRYLLVIALASRAQLHSDEGDPALLDVLRSLLQHDLDVHERIQLLRLMLRSMTALRDTHPVPELLDLVTADTNEPDALESLLTLHVTSEHAGSEEAVRAQLAQWMPALGHVLHQLSFILDYRLVIPSDGSLEDWTGLRHLRQRGTALDNTDWINHHPKLISREQPRQLDLWPLAEAVAPTEGSEPELFLFDGRGRETARLVAAPAALIRHEVAVSAWISVHVISPVETKLRMHEQVRISARQWHDRARPDGLLWRGEALADLERWRRHSAAVGLSDTESSFIQASRRYAWRMRWTRRGLVVVAIASIVWAINHRADRQIAQMAVTVAEVEQGRQALLRGEVAEATVHLERAYQRGDHSQATEFMLARALQPRRAELARFNATVGRMWSASFSPDGLRIATSDDQNAQIWDAQTYQLIFTLKHNDNVYEAHFSRDGHTLITVSRDGAVRIWRVDSGALIRTLAYHRSAPGAYRYTSLAMTKDGRLIAAIDEEGSITHVWDTNTGDMLVELQHGGRGLPEVAFSTDSRWLATTDGEDVSVFDTTTWKQTMTLAGIRARSLAFSPTTQLLAIGGVSGELTIRSIPDGQHVQRLQDSATSIDAIAFSPDGTLIASGDRDGAERVWEVGSGALRSQFNILRSDVRSLEFDPTSKLVAAAGTSGSVLISDAALGATVVLLSGPRNVARLAHFDPSSRRVIASSWDGTAYVWEVTTPYKRWSSMPLGDACGVASVDPDHRFLPVTCRDHPTRVWDTAKDQLLAELPEVLRAEGDYNSPFAAATTEGDRVAIARGHSVQVYTLPGGHLLQTVIHPASVSSVAFATHGHDLISGSVDGSVLVTRDSVKIPTVLPIASTAIDVVGFLPDGRIVYSDISQRLRIYTSRGDSLLADLKAQNRILFFRSSRDGHFLVSLPSYRRGAAPEVWDLNLYKAVAQLQGHIGPVRAASFDRSNSKIVTAGADGAVKLWDASTGQLLKTYSGGTRFLADAQLDPSETMVVAGDGDGLIRFWDADTGRPLWTLPAHIPYVVGLHFEGNDIVTRGYRGDVARWSLPDPEQVIKACGTRGAEAIDHHACASLP